MRTDLLLHRDWSTHMYISAIRDLLTRRTSRQVPPQQQGEALRWWYVWQIQSRRWITLRPSSTYRIRAQRPVYTWYRPLQSPRALRAKNWWIWTALRLQVQQDSQMTESLSWMRSFSLKPWRRQGILIFRSVFMKRIRCSSYSRE